MNIEAPDHKRDDAPTRTLLSPAIRARLAESSRRPREEPANRTTKEAPKHKTSRRPREDSTPRMRDSSPRHKTGGARRHTRDQDSKQSMNQGSKKKWAGHRKGKPRAVGGLISIQITKNNTILTLTDLSGRPKAWSSAGLAGFEGTRRSTAFAAQSAGELLGRKSTRLGVRTVKVKLKGFGKGRRSSLRGLKMGGVKIRTIEDVTPIAHNGCRAPKQRRK